MKISLTQTLYCVPRQFLAVVLSFVLATGGPAFAQEKPAVENPSAERVAKLDLAKYAAEATKWDKDVSKLSAGNATQGGPDTILCMGSSSFRLWDSISDDMAPYKVVRRAYGAMIFVANDITGKDKDKSPEEVARLAKIVVDSVRMQNAAAPVFLIAITPCPSRFDFWPTISMANQSLEKLCSPESKTFFIATQSKYLDKIGEPLAELFVKDMLHQNKDGYAIWSSLLKQALSENLP